MSVWAWWNELLRAGWLGGAVAIWIAATVVPLTVLAVASIGEQMRLAVRRAAAANALRPERRRPRLTSPAEDSI